MDWIRSAYRTTMDLGNGITAEVQWFRVGAGAKPFPGFTRFGSLNWLNPDDDKTGVGEVEGAERPWANGSYPFIPAGKAPDGPMECFLSGNNFAKYPLLTLNSVGIPAECGPAGGSYSREFDRSYDRVP